MVAIQLFAAKYLDFDKIHRNVFHTYMFFVLLKMWSLSKCLLYLMNCYFSLMPINIQNKPVS